MNALQLLAKIEFNRYDVNLVVNLILQMAYLHTIDSNILLGGEKVSFLPIELDEELQKKAE
jgi:hypothetical protein